MSLFQGVLNEGFTLLSEGIQIERFHCTCIPLSLCILTVSSLVAGGSTKERVNEWIHSQVVSFMERWVPPDEQHPALDAVRKLTDNVKKLKLSLSDYLEPLKVHVHVHIYVDIHT